MVVKGGLGWVFMCAALCVVCVYVCLFVCESHDGGGNGVCVDKGQKGGEGRNQSHVVVGSDPRTIHTS